MWPTNKTRKRLIPEDCWSRAKAGKTSKVYEKVAEVPMDALVPSAGQYIVVSFEGACQGLPGMLVVGSQRCASLFSRFEATQPVDTAVCLTDKKQEPPDWCSEPKARTIICEHGASGSKHAVWCWEYILGPDEVKHQDEANGTSSNCGARFDRFHSILPRMG